MPTAYKSFLLLSRRYALKRIVGALGFFVFGTAFLHNKKECLKKKRVLASFKIEFGKTINKKNFQKIRREFVINDKKLSTYIHLYKSQGLLIFEETRFDAKSNTWSALFSSPEAFDSFNNVVLRNSQIFSRDNLKSKGFQRVNTVTLV